MEDFARWVLEHYPSTRGGDSRAELVEWSFALSVETMDLIGACHEANRQQCVYDMGRMLYLIALICNRVAVPMHVMLMNETEEGTKPFEGAVMSGIAHTCGRFCKQMYAMAVHTEFESVEEMAGEDGAEVLNTLTDLLAYIGVGAGMLDETLISLARQYVTTHTETKR